MMEETSSRRWRLVLAAGLCATVLLAACVSDDSDSPTSDASESSTASTSSTAEASDAYGVGHREMTFVDPSRPTAAVPDIGAEAKPDRTLRTLVFYPTLEQTPVDAPDIPAEVAEGRFPLVLFSHGSGANPETFGPLVEPLVRLGYVVALPAFPISSIPGSPVWDAFNQPADVSFVLDQLLATDWIAPHVDADRIAAAGHSLGAVTTVGLVYDSCCVDDRIDAAVVLSGIGVPSGPGTLDARPPTPLLLVHGATDEIVPVSGSDALFEEATGPAYFLRLDDADHVSLGFGEDGELTSEAIRAFLAAELKDEPAGLAEMAEVVAGSGRGEWLVRIAG